MNRKGGDRRKSRSKMTKPAGTKGKLNIDRYLQTFKIGDKVQLLVDPMVRKGAFPLRFQGKHGIITKQQGEAYYVKIKDQNKEKSFIVRSIHIQRL